MEKDDTVEKQARALIADTLNIPQESIHLESKIADLSEDSIQLFELLLAFEREYSIKTVYDDIVRLQTVQDIVDYLTKHISK